MSRLRAGVENLGKGYAEDTTLSRHGLHGHVALQPADQRPHIGEADALARAILDAGAPEQFKDAFVILGRDAAA